MGLLAFKWIAAIAILMLSLIAGFASLGFARRYQKLLEIGDAVANGIFLGAAFFHLFPSAVEGFTKLNFLHTRLLTLIIIVATMAFLFLLEKGANYWKPDKQLRANIWILIITLTFHAFVTGVTLGISSTFTMVSIMFIAILAHKGFEMFALVVNLHKHFKVAAVLISIFVVFSWVTPFGIWLGSMSEMLMKAHLDSLLTAIFNACAAGTFIFIAISHQHHRQLQSESDSHHQYAKVLAMIAGIAVMGVISIWA